MMKKVRRTLAIILALFLAGRSFADYYVSARAENTTITIEESVSGNDAIMLLAGGSEIQSHESGLNVSDFGVYLDRDRNNPMTDDSDIYSGQDVTVYFHWSLDDNTRMSNDDYDNGNGFIYQEFIINTKAEGFQHEGIDLTTFETGTLPLYSTDAGRTEVGYYYLENGIIHIVFTDGEFYQNMTNRVGGVAFHGKMEQLEDKTKDGEKKRVQFGSGEGAFDANPDFFLSGNESGASVEKKRTANKVTVADGKYYQTFTVTIKAENGTVKNIDLTDVTTSDPMDVLKNISNVEITASTVDGVTATTYANLETALEAIKNATFYMDQEVTLQYTMEVDAAIYEEGNTWANNGITGSYTSNRGKKKNVESWTSVNVTKPSVDKNATEYNEDEGIITWEITVDLGDYFTGPSTDLGDYITSIEDIPGTGLNAPNLRSLPPSEFEYRGEGKWTYKVTTPVTSDVKDSLGDVQVENEVTMITNDDKKYHGKGFYTVEGQDDASVVKSVYKAERNENELYITWEIKVSDLPDGITNLTLTDNPDEWLPNMGDQKLISEIYVDDTKVFGVDGSESEPKILDSTIISKVGDGFLYGYNYGYSIVFQDVFIKEHHSFTVYLKTLITEDTLGKEYGNSASISYEDENYEDSKEVKGNTAVYRESSNLLEKSGEVNGNAINYKLQIALSTMQLENGKDFVIEDILPSGMKLVQNSVEVVLVTRWNYEMLTLEKGAYSLNTATANGQRQKMTVTVKVQNNWLNRVVGHTNIQDPAYYLAVKYTAVVNDAADFTIKGETIECINEASATYDGENIGSDNDVEELTPAPAVIKTADYTQDSSPYAKFTVDVNPSGITFLDGTEKLQVVDTLGWALSLVDADSFIEGNNVEENRKKYAVKVIDVNDGYRELEKDKDYFYSISDDRRTMEMELPDSKYLKVEYWARVNPGLPLSEENSTNRFNLSGFNSAATESSTSFSGTAFIPYAWAGSGDGNIILYKFWTDPEGNQQALLNSKFRLDRMRYDEQTDELVEDNNNDDSADRYTFPREIEIDDNNRYGEGKLIIERLPVNYIFKLTEIESDEGFDVNQEPYYFTVDGTTAIPASSKYKSSIHEFESNAEIQYENYYTGARAKIKISKTWSVTNGTNDLQWEEIKSTLSFVIKDTSGQSADIVVNGSDLTWVDNTNKYESKEYSVAPGTYIVEESNQLPNGFEFVVETSRQVTGDVTVSSASGTSVEVTLQESASVEVAYDNIYTYTGTFSIKVSKQAVGGQGEEIAGAWFKLIDSENNVVDHWNSTSEPYEIDLVPGTYTLQETSAPQGYKIAQDITFTVEPDGKVMVEGNEVTGKTVVMADEPLALEVDKVLAGENTVISGATLTLYVKSDLGEDGNLRQGVKGNLLSEDDGPPTWTSGGPSWQIGKYLFAGTNRTYVLVETKAPAGYSYSKSIEFTVGGDGEITILSGDGYIDPTTDSKILMEDKAISIRLSKLTLAGTDLEGATIGLYKASDLDDNGRPKGDTSPIGEPWTSGNEPYDFAAGRLEAGGEYALVEIAAPSDDYELAESIYFNVDKYGNIDVLDDAGKDLGGTPEEPVIKMYDLTQDEADNYATLVLRKTIGGVLDINDPDIFDKIGNLTFTVTGPTGPLSRERVYTIKDFRPPTSTRKSYELTIPMLTPGTYTVTESQYDVNGMNCTYTYTIEAVDASGEISHMDDGTTEGTGDIELQGGDRVIVTYNNNYTYKMGKIRLTKSYESSGDALDWADISRNLTFHIYEVTSAGIKKEIAELSPISGTSSKWTQRNNDHAYECEIDVKTGEYIIEETYTSIAGYDRTTSYRVTADGDTPTDFTSGNAIPAIDAFEVEEGKTTDVEFVNKYVRNYPISISKRDINGTEELEGAEMTVSGTPNDGSTFETVIWTSGKQGTDSSGKLKPYELQLKPGKYTLTEKTAPRGYALAQAAIEFEIKDNGEISITVDETKGAVDGNTLILKDAPMDIQVSKVDITGVREVKDATLVVYLAKDVENGSPKENSTPVVKPWVSTDTGQPQDIGSYLEVGATYVLIETVAPKGYAYSESIEFTVNADGSITTGNTTKYQGNTIHTDSLETTAGNRILMRDRAISIKLNKVELGSTTKELEGAVIGVYHADDIDANGRKKDPNTRAVEEWVSKEGEIHEFGTELEAGRDYVLLETAAPDGYQIATSIRFTVNEDGSIDSGSVTTVTGETVKWVQDGQDTVYLMEDDIYTGPRATLVLTKSVKGVDPADVTKTNLRFQVESIDVTPAYKEVFYVGSADFKWDNTESMYTQKIYNLQPGKYKVTEIWDDSSALGSICTGQTWEMVPTGASGIGSTSGTGVTTGEFSLRDGDTIEVNYTNTYEKNGTLIITKTIAGDITKEEAESTLTFMVTENSTNKKYFYTLLDDFGYNSETKQWTKELALAAGGYTVEEFVNTPGGKACTTTYTVIGENPRNDISGTWVPNVVLEVGRTTTVAYTNTYTPTSRGGPPSGNTSGITSNSSVLTGVGENVAASLTKTGDVAPIGAWLLLLLFGVAEVIDGVCALRRKKKKE